MSLYAKLSRILLFKACCQLVATIVSRKVGNFKLGFSFATNNKNRCENINHVRFSVDNPQPNFGDHENTNHPVFFADTLFAIMLFIMIMVVVTMMTLTSMVMVMIPGWPGSQSMHLSSLL